MISINSTAAGFGITNNGGQNQLLLLAFTYFQSSAVTAVSANSKPLTFLDTVTVESGNPLEVWYLENPDIGSNSLSFAGGVAQAPVLGIYDGVDLTDLFPDKALNPGINAAQMITPSTVTHDNGRLVGFGGTADPGNFQWQYTSPGVHRQIFPDNFVTFARSAFFGDSNGPLSAGNYNVQYDQINVTATHIAGIVVSLKPAPEPNALFFAGD